MNKRKYLNFKKEANKNIIFTAPVILFLATFSLFPSRLTPKITIFQIPISLKDFSIIAMGLPYSFIAFIKNRLYTDKNIWHKHLPLFITITFLYMAFSISWAGIDHNNSKAMIFVIILSLFTFIFAYSIICQLDTLNVKKFLWQITILLVIVSAVYTVESFFNIGLRSIEGKMIYDFGIQRVRGPLFGSSYGFFILLPAIGFTLNKATIEKWNMRIVIILITLLITLLGIGSRMGFLLLISYLIIITMKYLFKRNKTISIFIIIILLLISWLTITYKANVERFFKIHDLYRANTYEAALKIYAKADITRKIIGKGYGSIWSWYLPDVTVQSEEERQKTKIIKDIYGNYLYHPHSLLLPLWIEVGIIGMLFILILFIISYKTHLRLKKLGYELFSLSMLIGSLGFFTDLFLLKNWGASFIYWLFFLSMMKI